MIVAKVYRTANGLLLSVCDQELLGKRFKEGKVQLDLTSDFYRGEVVSEEKLGELMRVARIINIVGKKSIKVAVEMKILDKKNIIYIKGVPHAQIVVM